MTQTINPLKLPSMDGQEITSKDGRLCARIIGEPTPIPGTNKLRALADVDGCLCTVELAINFAREADPLPAPRKGG